MAEWASTANPTLRAFMVYALGKVKSPRIIQSVVLALDAAQSGNLELRDTATRAPGKFVESIPPAQLSGELKGKFIECPRRNLSDPNASVRAKAIRGLGELAKYRHLDDSEREQLKTVCCHIMGTDAEGNWDRAYVVRKEASEALAYA